ncbi:MAG: S-layer homology domain-containing protein [Actinomycetota bacterium]
MDTITRPVVMLVIAVLAVFAAGAGGVAYASHQFPDSTDGTFFHEAIGAIGEAGCAAGFADGTFKEGNPTTRGQFAFWTNNCGGRVAHDSGTTVHPDDNARTPAATSLTAGATANGAGFLFMQVNVRGFSGSCVDAGGCSVRVELQEKLSTEPSFTTTEELFLDYPQVAGEPLGNANPNGSMGDLMPLQSGETAQVRAVATRTAGTTSVDVEVDLTLMYFPFDGNGRGGAAL